MPRSPLRSLVSTLLATCFALVATAGMPGCAGHGTITAHDQHGSPGHGHDHHPGSQPASQACVVHICCAHLDTPTPVAAAAERLIEVRDARGFLPAAEPSAHRPPHTLPFAHAPPAVIA